MLARLCIGNDCSNVIDDLTNYYTKSEVDNLVGQLTSLEVVTVLPATGSPNVIYLVPKADAETDNIYDEYIYINNDWELIGSTEMSVIAHLVDGAADGSVRSNTASAEDQSYSLGTGAASLGTGTKAPSAGETAVGRWNVPGYAFSIGNGSNEQTRSNAFAVTTDGDAEMMFNSLASSGYDHDIYQALSTLGWQNVVYGQDLSQKALFAKIVEFIALIGQPLSMSNNNWTSGSCTITDSSKYLGFYVVQAGALVWAMKEGNAVRGSAISGNSDSGNYNQYVRVFGAQVSGDVWTMEWAKQLSHVASASYHVSGQEQAVTKVYGIIPDPTAVGGLLNMTVSQDIVSKYLTIE